MAEINNVQLTKFCNERLRTLGDMFAALAFTKVPAAIAQYNSEDLGTIINNLGSSNLITDGSEVDGRPRCTGGDVFNLVTLLQDFDTFMTQGRKDVLMKWNVNGV